MWLQMALVRINDVLDDRLGVEFIATCHGRFVEQSAGLRDLSLTELILHINVVRHEIKISRGYVTVLMFRLIS